MKTVTVRCPKCGHEWESRGRLVYVTCPSCMRKVPREGGKK